MWRSFPFLKYRLSVTVGRCIPISDGLFRTTFMKFNNPLCGCLFSSLTGGGHAHAFDRALHENAEALKMKLGVGGSEVVRYSELLQACESIGIAKSVEEAKEVAKMFDDAAVIFIFRDKVHLHPHKVLDMVRKAIPLPLMPDDDPRKEELMKLQAKQEEIDVLANKQVRHILWTGLGLSLAQASLFFRLTFWELSWDVMEPITFFTTSSSLILGYAYFLFTSRDPSYEDFMKRLFLSRRRKLMKKHNFDVQRFTELQKKCGPLDDPFSRISACRGGTELQKKCRPLDVVSHARNTFF